LDHCKKKTLLEVLLRLLRAPLSVFRSRFGRRARRSRRSTTPLTPLDDAERALRRRRRTLEHRRGALDARAAR